MEEYHASPRRATFIRLDYDRRPPVSESVGSSHDVSGRSRGTHLGTTTKNPPKGYVKVVIAEKRKQDSAYDEPVYVESCLVQLCRGGMWLGVIQRCQTHPEEAKVVPINAELAHDSPNNNNRFHRHSTKRAVSDTVRNNENSNNLNSVQGEICRDTALGIACASKESGEKEVLRKEAICALIEADPHQIGTSQLISGHTALRDAVLNDSNTPEILNALVKGSVRCYNGTLAFQLLDRNGFSLTDHLVMAVQLGSSPRSVEMISEFIRMQPFEVRRQKPHLSPLIRLLTLGNSFGVVQAQRRPLADEIHMSPWRKSETEEHARLKRVLTVTRCLLDDFPDLLHRCSKVSGCTPLHVALRNYGSYEPLIQELLQRDPSNEILKVRNSYGDLPIHVACSVGVPLRVLQLVLERTTQSIQTTPGIGSHHPLIWSANQSGYTPVDLEWVRHIESGDGFYTARSFYPLEATGVRRHCFKQDEFYQELLSEAVNQVMESDKVESSHSLVVPASREDEARAVFGYLMDRISLLVQASATGSLPTSLSEPAHLVDTCSLSTPYGPTLPLPVMELFLWLRPDEVMKVDGDGYLPIHHALHRAKKLVSSSPTSPRVVADWQAFVVRLIDTQPEQCKQKCRSGRLPLHYVLDHHTAALDGSGTKSYALQNARHAIVEKLVEQHPESLDQRDPLTGFYPFMMAAKDQNLSLDTVFSLLRRSPARCVVEAPAIRGNPHNIIQFHNSL
jgi:hypothetical protein